MAKEEYSNTMKQKSVLIIFLILAAIILGGRASAQVTIIKAASLMPEGSPWTIALHDLAREIKKQTQGKVQFKIYAGNPPGVEADVLRKMRVNQIHAAGFTGVGLGLIVPRMRVLDSPLLFNDVQGLDYVKEKLFDDFSQEYAKKGFVFLGFVDGGFVYFFSKTDLSNPENMAKAKMWMWKGDPMAENFLDAFHISTYPLHVSDVNTGLETGMIDSFYAPPVGAVAFQWFWRIRYMLDYPVVNSTGGFLMSQKIFDQLSPGQQAVVRKLTKEFCTELDRISRLANQEALSVLRDAGIKIVPPTPAQIIKFESSAQRAVEKNIPRLYSRELYDKIQAYLEEYRAITQTGRCLK